MLFVRLCDAKCEGSWNMCMKRAGVRGEGGHVSCGVIVLPRTPDLTQ